MATIEYSEYEVPISKFFKIIHHYTERIAIYVVCGGRESMEDKVTYNFYITRDAYQTDEEAERVLKYYGDVPVWNVHIEMDHVWDHAQHGKFICASIVGNVHYRDIREGYFLEREDQRREKRREYRQRKKQEQKNEH